MRGGRQGGGFCHAPMTELSLTLGGCGSCDRLLNQTASHFSRSSARSDPEWEMGVKGRGLNEETW
jgi:hypothetical protein